MLVCRDIVKKKRDEQLKMVWRVMPAHKKLQTRMEQMRKFRHQHEQLRSVIVRVLRPAAVPASDDMSNPPKDSSLDYANSSAAQVIIKILLYFSMCLVYDLGKEDNKMSIQIIIA